MCETACSQERARAKRKAIFELRAATIIKNNPLKRTKVSVFV